MITSLLSIIFGKDISGKRQAGWVLFLIVTGILLYMVHTDAHEWVSLMVIAWPISMGAAIGTHVVHHLRPRL